MTAGARSTEFWLALFGVAVGVGIAVTGVVSGRDLLVAVGALEQAAIVVGYAHSRGTTKAPRPYLPPAGRL